MKLLTVIYDSAIDTSLMGLFEDLGIHHWTKYHGTPGQGLSGLKVNTPVWPGMNNTILVANEPGVVDNLAAHIRMLQEQFKLRPGIFMFTHDIDVV